MKNFSNNYNKYHKKLIILPLLVLLASLAYLTFFYLEHDQISYRDVSLTGGTTITVFSDVNLIELEEFLYQEIENLETRSILDGVGRQIQAIIIVQEQDSDVAIGLIEEFLGFELDSDNSSIETTSSALSESFYRQILAAVFIAFFWMSAVVFVIFARDRKIKAAVIFLNFLLGALLGRIMGDFSTTNIILGSLIILFLLGTYIKHSIPAFMVILSIFSNIVMTLAVVNLLGMSLSLAGIVAFLMIIGYSVDTDILLTTRVLRGRHSINRELSDAFKTGLTMTLTSMVAVGTALIVVYNFGSVLNQIFTILLIGLSFDIFNTWTANAGILKWYVEAKNENNN